MEYKHQPDLGGGEWWGLPLVPAASGPGAIDVDVVAVDYRMLNVPFVARWREQPDGTGGHFDALELRMGCVIDLWCYLPRPPSGGPR